jgi:hypothetical protein
MGSSLRRVARIIVALALLAPAGFAAAAGLRLDIWPVPPVFTGTQYHFGVSFEKEDRNDGIVHVGPFTFRTMLPAGVRYQSFNGVNWTCSVQPDLRDVTCTYTGSLDFWNSGSMSLGLWAVTDYGITPGPATVSGTISSAQVPLPANPVCSTPPTTTGCASVATAYVTSKIEFTGWGVNTGGVGPGPVAVWTGAPYEIGQPNMFVLEMKNTGFGESNTPVTVDVWLPPGITPSGVVTGIPQWTCVPQALAGHVRCTTPYMYDTLAGYLGLHITVGNTVAVPGPVYVHAAISNDRQLRPADCVATPLQLGCARLQFHTRAPRVATMVASTLSHAPATATLGKEFGPVVFDYRNIGETSAGTTQLYLQLPPYIEFRQMISASPPATCTAQGALATGQTVVCRSSGLPSPPFNQGTLSLRLYGAAQAASPGPLPIVAAVELANSPNLATLASCVSNPAQSHCATDTITTYFPCALQWADGIFCDGLQRFVRP